MSVLSFILIVVVSLMAIGKIYSKGYSAGYKKGYSAGVEAQERINRLKKYDLSDEGYQPSFGAPADLIGLDGYVDLEENSVTWEEFFNEFVGWLESNNWYFGGGLQGYKEDKTIE